MTAGKVGTMALERELAYFDANREELVRHYEGQFALIEGECFLGAFTTFEQAFNAGVSLFGVRPFLVQCVTDEDALLQIPALAL